MKGLAPIPCSPIRPARLGPDRALESELAARGVTGVTITRKDADPSGGTVASDGASLTVYQFMNDKD
jgi:hypothetical protein